MPVLGRNATAVTLDFSTQNKDTTVLSCTDGSVIGTLGAQDTTILCSIAAEPSMDIQTVLHDNAKSQMSFLSAIIYGPLDEFDEIGDYLAEHNPFIQEP